MPKDVASFTVNHSHANSRVIPSAVPTILNLLRHRMIAVAMLACLFAVGMAALLNYFKYRSTTDGIVGGRLIVLGKQIENSIQASLALGIAFDDLGTLTGLMKREQTADGLIAEINVFDADGKCLYSTDQMRMVGQFTAHKAKQILVDRIPPKDIPVETLKRLSFKVRMEAAEKLSLPPPISLLNYAEIIPSGGS